MTSDAKIRRRINPSEFYKLECDHRWRIAEPYELNSDTGHTGSICEKCGALKTYMGAWVPVSYSGLKTGAFSSPDLVCSKIRDQIGPPGQLTCSDDLQRSQSCGNIGLRSAKDGFKSCFNRSLSGKSLAEPYRISIKRFTRWVPKMPKYIQEIDLTC